ncbi:MAG: type II toxin-antitoxin system RelE/ParE family toxin [Acidiferrobacterales bacterium]|nr:type II toxin-antitoxin system RelE/ParE family toxin [Acidiferrobacterales bacterium]
MLQIKITDSAKLDLVEVGQYTEHRWGERQRDKYLGDIDACLISLAEEPNLGRGRSELRTGCFSYSVGKHVIFFTHDSETLYVLAVLHERMDFERHL